MIARQDCIHHRAGGNANHSHEEYTVSNSGCGAQNYYNNDQQDDEAASVHSEAEPFNRFG